MYEARIICPTHDNEGNDLFKAYNALIRRLCDSFGGCTVTDGFGRWIDPKGALFAEPVKVLDVAVEDNKASRVALRRIASDLKRDARQQAIYLRLPTGKVEFV